MNIAFFSDNLYPEISGISDSILLLGKQLVSQGHRVAYIGPTYSKKDYDLVGATTEKEREDFEKFEFFRLHSFHIPFSPTNQAQFVIPYGQSVSFLKRFKPDIIHTQSPFGVGIEALIASKILKVPVVGTNHTLIEGITETLPIQNTWFKKFVYKIMSTYFNWYYNRCVFVTSPCQSLLQNMMNTGLHRKTRKVPNPISLNDFTVPTDEQKKNAQKFFLEPHLQYENWARNKYIHILFSGRLAPEKCVDVLINAVFGAQKKLNNTQLHLMIAGNGIAGNELKKQVHNLQQHTEKEGLLSPIISFTGFLQKKEMVLANQSADIFCMMSITETQCLSAMQAFSTGIPVIAAAKHGLIEYIPGNAGFLVPAHDAQKLSEIIIDLTQNNEERLYMGKEGVNYVQQFNPPHIAQIWESIYNEVINKSLK